MDTITKTDDRKIVGAITRLENAARDLETFIPSDGAIADACGDLRAVEVKLANRRRLWEQAAIAEQPAIVDDAPKYDRPPPRSAPVAVGKKYKLVPKFKTNRSYNTPALLVAIAGDELDLIGAIRLAQSYDAVRLAWRWTELKRLLSDQRIGLRTAYVEVSDDDGTDGFMVGEVEKQTGTDRVPIEAEEG